MWKMIFFIPFRAAQCIGNRPFWSEIFASIPSSISRLAFASSSVTQKKIGN